MTTRKTNCTIQWIEIYPLDSVIHLLDNWGLGSILLRHSKKISGFSVHSGEQIQKVADSYAGFPGCVWTTADSAQKSCNLKDIDTCGRDQCPLPPNFLKFYDGTLFVLHLLAKFSHGRQKSYLSAIQHSRKQNLTLLTLMANG